MDSNKVSPQVESTTRVVMVYGSPAARLQAIGKMKNSGKRVTRLADADALLDVLANGREEFDVAVVDLTLPGLCVADLVRWCSEAEIGPPEIILAPDDEQTDATGPDISRCLRISGPADPAAEDALRACSPAKAHRGRDWQTRMAELEHEAEERTRSLEAARAQAEKNYRDLQTAQSQLLQSEKLASIGQLAAGVAHEINNPIGFIYSNMNTLCDYIADFKEFAERCSQAHNFLLTDQIDKATDLLRKLGNWCAEVGMDYMLEDIQSLVDETIDGAERVKKIVMDLRSFSRAEENQKTTSDINKGLESTINLCWNELKYHCEIVKELGDIPDLICYPMKLNQVFMNLIVNAAQAIEDKGTVTIRTWHENNNIYVQVSDTGCGIPKESQDKIFDPFFTTKPVGKGTGLGLSIAGSIIAEHNGEITIDSEIGKGTTFRVRLPVTGEEDA
ncbi:MAG: hypothetical protein HQ592_09645 [Planctomycetes bacterium]|nr:hypothetical protein [Planctomycetota bacterium]